MRVLATFTIAASLAATSLLQSVFAAEAVFGRHYPNGAAAVDYLYGQDGTWKDLTGLSFVWNYYSHCETPDKPASFFDLVRLGGTTKLTAPDADCLLLGDLDNDGDIADDRPTGYAFHEHAGRGSGGVRAATPFLQFWFDDNWLARYVAAAYARPQPSGLHDHGYTLRWRALDGSTHGAAVYASPAHIDQLALNSLRRLNAGDLNGALGDWHAIKALARPTYDWQDQRYEYGGVRETYHLALWGILSERLLAASVDFWSRNDVTQHAESIRSNLLSLQQRDASGNWIGWISGIDDPATLINTETVSLSVLALGAGATWVFEPGYAPLRTGDGGYFLRPHNVLSAVVALSGRGHMIYGPYWTVEPGAYQVEFSLRAPTRGARRRLATVDIYDGNSILGTETLTEAMMPGDNQWLRRRVIVNVTNPKNSIEFRVYWHGSTNLDVGAVRVLRLDDNAPSAPPAQAVFPVPRSNALPEPMTLRELFLRWLGHRPKAERR